MFKSFKFSKKKSEKQEEKEEEKSEEIIPHPNTQSYAGITQNIGYIDLQALVNGEKDRLFQETMSVFKVNCKIFSTLEEVEDHYAKYRAKEFGILEINCSKEEAINLAAQGKFSQSILRAYHLGHHKFFERQPSSRLVH